MVNYKDINELREIAKDHGIKNVSRKSEARLVDELRYMIDADKASKEDASKLVGMANIDDVFQYNEHSPKESKEVPKKEQKSYMELLREAQESDKHSETIKEAQAIKLLQRKAIAKSRRDEQMRQMFKFRRK